jgi:uncharacterized protein (TIGR03000 family)
MNTATVILGGCHGSSFGGCFGGCYGGGWGYGSCHGCCGGGGHGCCGGGHHGHEGEKEKGKEKVKEKTTIKEKTTEREGSKDKEGDEEETSTEAEAAPARLVVTLPADATLKVDGAATRSTGAERTFVTPALPAGKALAYTLQVEGKGKDGKAVSWEQKATVRAGQTTRITLKAPTTVASR